MAGGWVTSGRSSASTGARKTARRFRKDPAKSRRSLLRKGPSLNKRNSQAPPLDGYADSPFSKLKCGQPFILQHVTGPKIPSQGAIVRRPHVDPPTENRVQHRLEGQDQPVKPASSPLRKRSVTMPPDKSLALLSA